jgi:hypothetical protein
MSAALYAGRERRTTTLTRPTRSGEISPDEAGLTERRSERDGDGEPDAAVAGHLERLEEEPGYREKEGVEAEGYRGVEGP